MRAWWSLLVFGGMVALAGCSAGHGVSAARTPTTVSSAQWAHEAVRFASALEISLGGMNSEISTLPKSAVQEVTLECPEFRSAYADASQVAAPPVANLALDWAAYLRSFASLNTLCTPGRSEAAFDSAVKSTYAGSNAALTH